MNFGITNTAYYDEKTGCVNYKKMREDGFNCGDYQQLSNVNSEIFTKSSTEFQRILTEEKEDAHNNGIVFSQVHAPFYVCDVDSAKYQNLLECTKKAILGTKYLDCKHLVVHTIMPQPWGGNEDFNKTRNINVCFFNEICDYAQLHDVNICAENLPFKNHTLSLTNELINFIKKLKKDNLFICLDTGHSHINNENIKESIELCGEKLKVFHIHDNKQNGDLHLPPYCGNLNWENFKKGIETIKFNGCLSLETEYKRNCPTVLRNTLMQSLVKTLEYFSNIDTK